MKSFEGKSGIGYPFICHLRDFAGEAPFYNPEHCRAEIELMARWCARQPGMLAFDVGANVGFVATQLAQAAPTCRIVAFEPVYSTFAKLVKSVEALGLATRIQTINCAVSDRGGVNSITFDRRESLFAQVCDPASELRNGQLLTWAAVVTIDCVCAALGRPGLLKVDVEGYEAHVFRGAHAVLQSMAPPAICFELNPATLRQAGSSIDAVAAELRGYEFFYVDDFEDQRLRRGTQIEDLTSLEWCCNLFAIPKSSNTDHVRSLFG